MNNYLKDKLKRYIAFFLAINILFEIIAPSAAFALTNGTYQAEYLTFEPAGASEMVDLFTGDFKYNIPLMDVDGYPLNLSYHAGIGMDQEASWVGLGWNINAGAINRVMKGVPDDFNGDVINSETYEKPRYTVGVGGEIVTNNNSSVSYESMSIGTGTGFSAGMMLLYNNYKGFGLQPHFDANLSVNLGICGVGGSLGGGVGVNVSSLDGATISSYYDVGASVGFGGLSVSHNVGIGTSVNTRTGDETKSYMSSTSLGLGPITLGVGHSHTIPAGSYAHTPSFHNSYKGIGASITAKFGLYMCAQITIYGVTFGTEQGLYMGFNSMLNYSELSKKVNNLPAYGYMNLENASLNSLLDFNRDKDGPFFKESPHAPMASHTYDIFSATAQGLYNNFRTFRSDVGTVYDNAGSLINTSIHGGMEIGAGIFAHLVLDAQGSTSIGSSGKWITQLGKSHNYYNPDITNSSNRYYEKAYFKNMGEQTAQDASFSAAVGNESAITPALVASSGSSCDALSTFPGAGAAGPNGSVKRNNKRDIRKNNIVYLSADEASKFALEKQIINYSKNVHNINSSTRAVDYSNSPITRTSLTGTTIDHHLSEISVTKEDGMRYFYGLPLYSLSKKKVVFNASQYIKNTNINIPALSTSIDIGPFSTTPALTVNSNYEMTEYTTSEIGQTNRRGLDNFFHKEEIPPYAQSYLLTCIVSPDYVDLTGNGPSYDDLGEYTKFNYTKTSDNYKWKIPYGMPGNYSKVAALDRGLLADDLDDKGFYEYGERQVWYLHSIETKNYVAEFTLSSSVRSDMMGVSSEDGATASSDNNRYYLDKITLYSKAEKLASSNPTPIKTVNFEYDYSLCKGVFNNSNTSNGKLTLKKVWFTYGNSLKGRLTPYQFSYGDPDHDGDTDPSYNPNYDPKGIDRWGNVKKRGSNNTDASGTLGKLNFDEFPYADQRKDSADVAAAAWNLSTINTPSGSQINVDYESDDYGYVQAAPAAQMLMLADITNSNNFSSWSPSSTNSNITTAKYFVLDLERLNVNGISSSITGSAAKSILKNKLLNNAKEMYFKCFTKLNTKDLLPGQSKRYYDYISGYAEIDYNDIDIITSIGSGSPTYAIGSNTYHKYAYVAVKLDGHKDDGTGSLVNPVVKAGWQMLRTYLPKIAYPGSETNNLGTNSSNPIMILVGMLAGLNTAMIDLATGLSDDPNLRFLISGYCSEVKFDKSWVRAFSPNRKKLGGGHRVKQITMSDNWASMTGENESTYGQTYSYTTTEGATTISSGVASYEPLIGGDEISLRKPVEFSVPHKYAPDDHYFMEEPLGEAFYPSALVGYSKVTVKNINYTYSGNDVCPIGQTSYEFYTAKDFPIKYVPGGINKLSIETDPIDDITVMADVYKSLSVADGHVLKFNDMHGKLRGVYTYAQNNLLAPISGTTYYYKRAGNNLIQSVQTIDENKNISGTVLGRDIDAVTDLRNTSSVNSGLNVSDYFNLGLCDGPFFGTHISSGTQYYDFNMAVTTKFIQQSGILEKVESFDNKSKVTTQNLLWDKNTGDVVMTQTTNNYDAPVYTFSYPAYWGYADMGPSYKRQNITLKLTSSDWNHTNSEFLSYSTVNGIIKDGDEVALTNSSGTALKCWVVYSQAASTFRLMKQDGVLITSSYLGSSAGYPYTLKVMRPVERNQFNYSAGSVTTLHNPFVATGSSTVPDLDDQVVSASATEYCSKWNVYCTSDAGNMADCFSSGTTYNPFTIGLAGNWRPWKSYAYKTVRDYSNTQPNTKSDGTFVVFKPFWRVTGSPSKWVPEYTVTNLDNWILQSENTGFSPNGNLVESKDALGLYHSQLYGYNHTLLAAKANNAKSSQIAYDGFEDYMNIYNYFATCGKMSMNNLQLFSLINGTSQPVISTTTAHTGKNSLYIASGQTLTTTYQGAPIAPDPYFGDDTPPPCSNREVCVNKLIIEAGKYISSFWVRRYDTDADLSTYPIYSITGSGITVNNTKKSMMINGWQKIDVEFTKTGTSTVTFNFGGITGGLYLDDWRVQPFNSSMTTYVYDCNQLRPWAELDDRNFATIMEYDSEGTLVRTKKETEKGIYTLNENRKSIVKQ